MKLPFRVAAISDIHIGHARNETPFILKNLRVAFPDTAETAELDLLVIVGDLFDGLLSLPDEHIAEIDFFIIYLLRLCKKHDIVLRVLEGTPSHDWKQSQRFVTLNEGAKIHCDLGYISQLKVEYVERFDAHFLFIPDEWDENPQKTLEEVKEQMQLQGLEKVDFCFMHGQFEYQLPPVVKAPKHDSAAYLGLVKYFIFIGHIHIFSRHDRIIAQGSFDRLAHGEEEPKGHVRALIKENGDCDITFVENKGARRFITIELGQEDLTTSFDLIEDRLIEEDIAEGSFCRISCNKDHPLLSSMDYLFRRWPTITWSKLVKDVEEAANHPLTDAQLTDENFQPITITKDNIETLLMLRLKLKTEDPDTLAIANRAILELK